MKKKIIILSLIIILLVLLISIRLISENSRQKDEKLLIIEEIKKSLTDKYGDDISDIIYSRDDGKFYIYTKITREENKKIELYSVNKKKIEDIKVFKIMGYIGE